MLFDDEYKTILNSVEGIYKEKGSTFHGFAIPVHSGDEVKAIMQQIKKEHPKANHHCYAFRAGQDHSSFRFSDDREPSGTAGKPILNQIMASGLTDILVVVVRYFGGSLLGVPGLIHAYKSAAADAIAHATIIEKFITEKYRVSFGFDVLNEIMVLLKSFNTTITRQVMAEESVIEFTIRKKNADELLSKIKKIYKGKRPPEIEVLFN